MSIALVLLRRFWPYLLAVVALGALWAWHATKVHQADRAGYQRAQLERKAQDEAATTAHNARIAEINRGHQNDLAELARQRDDALSHPVLRTIRVRVPSTCPATADAGVSTAGPSEPVYVSVPDEGFGELRKWLIHFGAGPDHGGGAASAVPAGR